MKRSKKLIVSLLASLAIVSSISIPVFATESTYTETYDVSSTSENNDYIQAVLPNGEITYIRKDLVNSLDNELIGSKEIYLDQYGNRIDPNGYALSSSTRLSIPAYQCSIRLYDLDNRVPGIGPNYYSYRMTINLNALDPACYFLRLNWIAKPISHDEISNTINYNPMDFVRTAQDETLIIYEQGKQPWLLSVETTINGYTSLGLFTDTDTIVGAIKG